MAHLRSHFNRGRLPGLVSLHRWGVRLLVLSVVVGGVACDQTAGTTNGGGGEEETPEGPTYRNPVMGRDFPDPTVLQGPDSTYYAYATETLIDGQFYNIQAAQSEDLVEWSWEGGVLPEGVEWAQEGRSYWAPNVVYDEEQERYIMYFSAHHDEKDGKCLAVATADNPLGPFASVGEPLVCGEGFEHIDPMAFEDPETGTHYLYWGSYGQPIRVRELADDRLGFKPDTEATPVVSPDPDEPYGDLIEGAWVIERNGTYYLFYSGDNCCGEQAHYAVMVARAQSPTGPFETLGEARGTNRSTILVADETWKAPGHNSVIQDAQGQDWMVYHAINRAQPTRPTGTGARWDRRVLLIDRITYSGGWPRIEGSEPSVVASVPATTPGGD